MFSFRRLYKALLEIMLLLVGMITFSILFYCCILAYMWRLHNGLEKRQEGIEAAAFFSVLFGILFIVTFLGWTVLIIVLSVCTGFVFSASLVNNISNLAEINAMLNQMPHTQLDFKRLGKMLLVERI